MNYRALVPLALAAVIAFAQPVAFIAQEVGKAAEILAAARGQIAHGRYGPSHLYYRPGASQAMVDVLAGAELYTQKRFCDGAAAPLV